ncbi:hypothetical protein CLF_107792 [Clonorchis sinensis]|uniref:Uncharacterized protein n=1 Tax=Clonorchis sinensis TaxID=79923 RepID=G7YR05_CLOSI|nr:hypothetical protein CLF_107792 [Clonorchis sinensis]
MEHVRHHTCTHGCWGNEDVLSGRVLGIESTQYPAIPGLETQFAIIHPTWSVIYIPRDPQTDQKNTCDLTLASSYLCKFPWPTQKPRCSQNCTSQPNHLKRDVRYGAVQKPKYGSAMMAQHCHTQFDSTPATNLFLVSTVPFCPLGPLPATTNKLMLTSECNIVIMPVRSCYPPVVNEYYCYLTLCECRVHTKGRDDFEVFLRRFLFCVPDIDTAVSLRCLNYSNETPRALNGPKNTLNACRSEFVTISWRIVTTITTLNDSPKMFMNGAVHGPKYGVAMTRNFGCASKARPLLKLLQSKFKNECTPISTNGGKLKQIAAKNEAIASGATLESMGESESEDLHALSLKKSEQACRKELDAINNQVSGICTNNDFSTLTLLNPQCLSLCLIDTVTELRCRRQTSL